MSSILGIKGIDQTRKLFGPALLFMSMAWKAGLNLNKYFLKPEEETVLLRQLKSGGSVARKARETITSKLQPLIDETTKLFARGGSDHEDMMQDGNIGLLEAIDKYDHRSGMKFSLFALTLIGARMARAASGYKENVSFGYDIDKIPALNAMNIENNTLIESFISRHLNFLNERERGVLELMIGLGMTPQEAGEILGLNRSETERLKKVALEKMRAAIAVAQQTVYQQMIAIEQIKLFFNSSDQRMPN